VCFLRALSANALEARHELQSRAAATDRREANKGAHLNAIIVAKRCRHGYSVAPLYSRRSKNSSQPRSPDPSAVIPVRSFALRFSRTVVTMSTTSNFELGPRLRAYRERRGITIAAVADSIKIKRSLLDELERNDVSRWPPGIYGRALVREYAKSLGLPADDVVQQFVQLFSGSEQRADMVAVPAGELEGADAARLRLTLNGTSTAARRSIQVRFVVAGVEMASVLTTALLVAFITGVSAWITTAVVALTWHAAKGVLCGYDDLYRILRIRRFSAVSRWTHIINKPLAARLMSIGKTMVNPRVSPTADSLLVEPDLTSDPSSSTSVH
jgi:transcriptional regulator with XRE-family HTH domain